MLRSAPLIIASLLLVEGAARAGDGVTVAEVSGDVTVRAPKSKTYARVAAGASLADRSRLKTGADGKATLRYADGTSAEVRPKSEILVHAKKGEDDPNGATLFFGRVWSKVAKSAGGETAFEVESANAVAGVRGTEFEVGVADDGAARVIVSDGSVAVSGDEGGAIEIARGYEIESSSDGRLEGKKKMGKDPDWAGWFSKRAKNLERKGVEVATDLDGRVSRRWRQVEKLVRQQRVLREEIQKMEKGGAGEDELQAKLDELERVTERLESMRDRLEAAFGMFEKWGAMAAEGMKDGDRVGKICGGMQKMAADFADMIEEGTDLSEESMDEMIDDMEKGPTMKSKKKSAADELFE
jgi:hypothetical protein